MKVVTTESGTVYEVDKGRVRRVGGGILRRDGEWLNYTNKPVINLGSGMVFELEPLSESAVMTLRETTPVVSIEEK